MDYDQVASLVCKLAKPEDRLVAKYRDTVPNRTDVTIEDLKFSFEAEDNSAAVRRSVEILSALYGELPEILVDEDVIYMAKRKPKGKPTMKPGSCGK